MGRHDDQELLLEGVAAFVEHEVAPRAAAIDEADAFPHELYRQMGALGLLGVWVPEAYGGNPVGLGSSLAMVERLARTSGSVSLIFANCADGVGPLLAAGGEERERWLPGIATGDVIPCFALTEPEAGSDAASITTRARLDGSDWVIDGSKAWCTNGSVGHVFTVFARTGDGPRDISAFVVPRGTPGLEIGRDERMLGLRGCPATPLGLAGVRVPGSALIGEAGTGLRLALGSLDESRLNASAMALGVARGAVEIAVAYARERRQFGKPIIEHQGIAFLLAEVVSELRAGWAILGAAIAALEEERSRASSVQAAMAKLFCTDVAMRAVTEAVQVLGGNGLAAEYRVERMLRDAKAFQIFDGTSQIQKLIIGRYLAKVDVPLPDAF